MYCGMPKGTARAEATSNSEKIKPVALAVIELCWSEGISWSVSQLVSRKFCGNFLKAFWVDLKACLGLFYLTNSIPSSSGKIKAGFWVILHRGPRLLLCPYYE